MLRTALCFLFAIMAQGGIVYAQSGEQDDIPSAVPVGEEYIPTAEPVPDAVPVAPLASKSSIRLPSKDFSSIPVPQSQTQVAVLGYHDFDEHKVATDMRIKTSVFRDQMAALKEAGVPVISMQEFLEWKNGNKQLPAKCVLITIDDGWKSVYTDAFPVLKEFGFPFTVFPYTKFITSIGSSISREQLQEMLQHGASIGSHSVSHLYPKSWRAAQRKSEQAVLDLAQTEIADSRRILQDKFPGADILTYCYPGGYVLPEMITKIQEAGYTAAFTVIPKKVVKDTDAWQIPRYMVYGKLPWTFTKALTFAEQPLPEAPGDRQPVAPAILPPPVQKVTPAANSTVHAQGPVISIVLPHDITLDTKYMEMRVRGFGLVPAKFDVERRTLSWVVSRPIHKSPVEVQARWKNVTDNTWQTATWQFSMAEQQHRYLPDNLVE